MKIESTRCQTTHYACECVLERMRKLEAALRRLLICADCSWEERGEGHDWADACQKAREALAADKGVKNNV